MKTVTIELFRLEKDGRTCQRCEETAKVARKVSDKMTEALRNMKVDLVLKEVPLTENSHALSNTVRINGRDINEIIAEKESFDTDARHALPFSGGLPAAGYSSFRGRNLIPCQRCSRKQSLQSFPNRLHSQRTRQFQKYYATVRMNVPGIIPSENSVSEVITAGSGPAKSFHTRYDSAKNAHP